MKQLTVNAIVAVPRDTGQQRFIHVEYTPFAGVTATTDIVTYNTVAKCYHFLGGDYIGDELIEIVHKDEHSSIMMITRQHEFKEVTENNYSGYFEHTLRMTASDSKVHVSNRAKHDKTKNSKAKSVNTLKLIDKVKNDYWRGDLSGLDENERRVAKLAETWVPRSTSKNAKNAQVTVAKATKAEKFLATVAKQVVVNTTDDEVNKKNTKLSIVELPLATLFTNQESLIEHGTCQAGIFDLYCHVQLAEPFLSESLERALNPMSIHIKSVAPLPTTPLDLDQLRVQCARPYVQFCLFDKLYTSRPLDLSRRLRFDATFVVLTGTANNNDLRQWLDMARVEFWLHDRDRLDTSFEPALYGADPLDAFWSRGGAHLVQARSSSDSTGCAALNVSELARGVTRINAHVPVLPVAAPDRNGLMAGHYLQGKLTSSRTKEKLLHQAGTEMHVKINLKYPLKLTNVGFGTVIIVSHDHTGLVEQLKRRVIESNHRFGFDPSNPDTFTGFHIQTRRGPTIFVVEADSVSLHGWLGQLGELMTTPSVRVHYDSSVVFSHRRYEQLDARFTRIILNFPIAQDDMGLICLILLLCVTS